MLPYLTCAVLSLRGNKVALAGQKNGAGKCDPAVELFFFYFLPLRSGNILSNNKKAKCEHNYRKLHEEIFAVDSKIMSWKKGKKALTKTANPANVAEYANILLTFNCPILIAGFAVSR